jgi:hypothetical protein
MAFLTPLFFVALAGIAIPVIIHLIQKERKNVVAFPSLMFLRRIPYQSVDRRRIRNWPLLLLRIAALALLVTAFARPFLKRDTLAAAAAGGAREVVVLLDRSYSLAYGDRWQRAIAAATDVVNGLSASDRASIVLFDTDAEVLLRSTSDKGRLTSAVAGARPGSSATKYGPAIKLAGTIISESGLPNREVVVISDFQRLGWAGAEGVRLPDGTKVTPISIADAETANVAVTPASLQRTMFQEQERVTVTAGALNRGAAPVRVRLSLEVDGRGLESKELALEPHGSATATFSPFTPTAKFTRGTLRLGDDRLPPDNAYHFVVSPRQRLKVIIVERPGMSQAASLYLAQALGLSETPTFDVVRRSMDTVTAEDISTAAAIVLNDVPVAPLTAERLTKFVQAGGGLMTVLGERATWPSEHSEVMPVLAQGTSDRTRGTPGRIGAVDYGHPVFEGFRAPRSGDFSVARFYNYRAVTVQPGAQVLARFDDGAPALIERRVGAGRVIAWTSTLDVTWNDLALKPVFLPFMHRVSATLASFTQRPASMKVGEVVPAKESSLMLTPSGARVQAGDKATAVQLREQGFYEMRAGERDTEPLVMASNIDLAESDMTAIDPNDLVAGATGRAGGAATAGSNAIVTNEERERSQRVWWYLLFGGLLLLAGETVAGNAVKTRYR